jgi:hypothetical protein
MLLACHAVGPAKADRNPSSASYVLSVNFKKGQTNNFKKGQTNNAKDKSIRNPGIKNINTKQPKDRIKAKNTIQK